ncbi:MAG: translocation/assembly module TamB domain-containing protein [Candidatus Zixiibacteriota bacterium]|nr:MAG: translocation/assembly module TamB domain-containing protein [candidate division Zixibacteria bacterium]
MRRWLKIIAITILTLVLLIGGAYLYLFHLGGIETVINAKISGLVEQRYRLDVKIGRVKGSFLSDLVVENVVVYYDDPTRRYQILTVPRISASYALANIWEERFIFDYLFVDSAEIVMLQDTTGEWVIPDFTPKREPDDTAATRLPSFSVGNLGLRDLSIRLVKPDDTVSFDDIFVSLAFKGEDNTYSVDVEQFEFTSNRQKLQLNAAGGKVTLADNRLLFQDVALVSGDVRMKLSGNIDLGGPPAGIVSFAADNMDLADVTAYVGPRLKGVVDVNGTVNFTGSALSGTVDIGGDFMMASLQNLFVDFSYENGFLYFDTLYGTILENCAVDGGGYVDFTERPETYMLEADIKGFNLNTLVGGTFESDLNGNIIMYGESFRNADLALDLHAELYESSFDEYPIHRGFGDVLITTDSLIFLDSFRVNYYENLFYASGKIDYGEGIDLDIAIDLPNLDRYRGKLFIDQPGGRGRARATLTGQTSDPDLRGYFTSDSIWIYGLYSDSMYATVEIDRFLSRKLGTVEVDFFDGTVYETPYDTGYALLRVDSNLVFFDTARIANPFTSLVVAGDYDYEAIPGLLTVDSLSLDLFGQDFYNRSKIVVEVDSLGFQFTQAAIGNNGAGLTVRGRANYDETMDMMLSVSHLPIEPWKNLFVESLLVTGYLSAEASLTGSFAEPQFIINAFLDSLEYEGLLLGDIATSVTYDNRLLNIENFQLLSEYGDYRADGSFYVDLAFTADSLERFPDLPMEIRIAAVDSRFDLVSLLQPSVEDLTGDFFADFVLSGTPLDPHLEGEAFMINPRLKYFDLEERLFGDSISVTMENNRIIIDTLEAYYAKDTTNLSERVSVFARGTITVMSLDRFYYDLDVRVPEKFPFRYELDDISGEFEGNLRVEGDSPPRVVGDLEMSSMRYLVNFAEPNELSPVIKAFEGDNLWDLEVDFSIPSNYWIKNEDIDAEFAGEVTMLRNAGVYSFVGQMEVLRGRGFLFDKIFQLEPGGLVTFEGGETFNPLLEIEANTYIAGSRGTDEEDRNIEQLRLGILITGTLEEPEINVTEDSDVGSREDILPLIVANQYAGEGGTATTSLETRVASLVSTQLSQIGSRQLGRLGVETFELDPGYSGEFDPLETRVTLGRYWTPHFYTYGRSSLSGQSRQEVGFEYRFNKSVILEGLRDEDELYHLNLKLNWEF